MNHSLAVGYVGLSQQSSCEAVKILGLWERGEINRPEASNSAALLLFSFSALLDMNAAFL